MKKTMIITMITSLIYGLVLLTNKDQITYLSQIYYGQSPNFDLVTLIFWMIYFIGGVLIIYNDVNEDINKYYYLNFVYKKTKIKWLYNYTLKIFLNLLFYVSFLSIINALILYNSIDIYDYQNYLITSMQLLISFTVISQLYLLINLKTNAEISFYLIISISVVITIISAFCFVYDSNYQLLYLFGFNGAMSSRNDVYNQFDQINYVYYPIISFIEYILLLICSIQVLNRKDFL